MEEWIVQTVAALGLIGIFLLMALENVVPPVPSEAIMGAAGLAVAAGELSFWPVIAAGTLGSVAGNAAWYVLGYRLGYRRLQPFVERHARWLTVEWRDVERAARFFARHGQWVVLALRMAPVMRTMISLPAGLARMHPVRFLAFTAIGTTGWNLMLVLGAGWLSEGGIGSQIVAWVLIGSGVLGVLAYLWRVAIWKPR